MEPMLGAGGDRRDTSVSAQDAPRPPAWTMTPARMQLTPAPRRRQARPWVLGLSATHNGAACLLRGDEIVVAVQEERLTRRKRDLLVPSRPALAIQYCLDAAGIHPRELAAIVVAGTEDPSSELHDVSLNPVLRPALHQVPTCQISHHLAHAISAFALSGFPAADVLVIDGLGSGFHHLPAAERRVAQPRPRRYANETLTAYRADRSGLRPLFKHISDGWRGFRNYRLSGFRGLGLMYSAVAHLLFGADEPGKVMGLAAYGKPIYPIEEFFVWRKGRIVWTEAITRRFVSGAPWPAHQQEYQNLAASVQAALEHAVLEIARRLRSPRSRYLCYAGGVALNSITNERLFRETGYEDLFIIPAAEDSGTAIGAAYHGLWQLKRRVIVGPRLVRDATGRRYTQAEIDRAVQATPAITVEPSADAPVQRAAELLARGKIVGWFQGRSELGPRALGQRSILCDPRGPRTKDVLNLKVKHREPFRPFAPAVLREHAPSWFEVAEGFESPFMLRVCAFRPDKRDQVPAVVHADGTGRVQTLTRAANGRFYDLVAAFHRLTGVPLLLNTSFNVAGEPIVETPEDALWCLLSTGIDYLVLEDTIVRKRRGYHSSLQLVPRLAPFSLIEETPVGAQAPEARRAVRARVATPWGPAEHTVDAAALRVLQAIDGRRDGFGVLRQVNATAGPQLDETAFARKLSLLRRQRLLGFAPPRRPSPPR
jgi:carbamoyltransferase